MAIAYDTATDGGEVTSTSLTFSHTCTGTDRILFVGVEGDITTDDITGATYNGVAMTLVGKVQKDRWAYMFHLENPASGAHNVVISASSSHIIGGKSVSYTGAKQTGQTDNSTTGTTVSSSVTLTLTTVANNCWTIMFAHGNNTTGGAGTTIRLSSNGFAFGDSNAAITPAGSTSLTFSATANWAAIMASFSPATATINSNFLAIL